MKATLFIAAAQALSKYVPASDIYIQFVEHSDQPTEEENLQLQWHAPPSIYDEYDAAKGTFVNRMADGDTLIPAEEMDKFWMPAVFHPVEGVFNTHNGKYPGRQMAAYDKLEVEPENSYDIVKKDWQKW